jgi:hypothetical protein
MPILELTGREAKRLLPSATNEDDDDYGEFPLLCAQCE